MADHEPFSLTCPCCGTTLRIDGAKGVLLSHETPPERTEKTSFEDRLKTIETEKRLAEDKFQESIRSEKNKKEVLDQKFNDLFKKAKEGPVGPMKRSIDLD